MPSRKPSVKAYDSIEDLPVLIWDKINESKDVSLLLLNKPKITKRIKAELVLVWEKIYNEFISEFGFPESVKDQMRLRLKIARMKLEFAKTLDESLITFIELAEIELAEMTPKETKSNIYKVKSAIEDKKGFRLNLKEISVKEFYNYVNELRS